MYRIQKEKLNNTPPPPPKKKKNKQKKKTKKEKQRNHAQFEFSFFKIDQRIFFRCYSGILIVSTPMIRSYVFVLMLSSVLIFFLL